MNKSHCTIGLKTKSHSLSNLNFNQIILKHTSLNPDETIRTLAFKSPEERQL